MKKPTRVIPYLSPLLKKLQRGPAVTLPKDTGMIIAYAGLTKESRVIELGSGSGFLTCQLASIAKEVVSYEKREEFLEIAKGNAKKLGLDNVTFKLQNVLEKDIDEQDGSWDLVMCDIAEAERAVLPSYNALKKGGFMAAHCLHIEQAVALVKEAKKQFSEVMLLENIAREYDCDDRGTKPKHLGLLHTAYLVFARK